MDDRFGIGSNTLNPTSDKLPRNILNIVLEVDSRTIDNNDCDYVWETKLKWGK